MSFDFNRWKGVLSMARITKQRRLEMVKELSEAGYQGPVDSFFIVDVGSDRTGPSGWKRVCYGGLIECPRIKELFVFHLPLPGVDLQFSDYILNRSGYKDVFLTKDLDEGFKSGFQINCDMPSNAVLGAIISLRETFAGNIKGATVGNIFSEGLKEGYSEEDMEFLISKVNIFYRHGKTHFKNRTWDSDHHPISCCQSYSDFKKGMREGWLEGPPVKERYRVEPRMVVNNRVRTRNIVIDIYSNSIGETMSLLKKESN